MECYDHTFDRPEPLVQLSSESTCEVSLISKRSWFQCFVLTFDVILLIPRGFVDR